MSSTPPLLEAVGASRSFGETRALTDARLVVQRGQIVALAGENGSGKSTLIKLLSGVLRPDAGELRWAGAAARFGSPSASQKAGISTVFQETYVAPELSIRDNVYVGTDAVFRRARSNSAETDGALAALEAVGAGGLAVERPVWTLSLAERQLVTIARAIVRPWQLLILDEATSALDEHQRDRLFTFLRRERDDGKAIVFTSHRMDELAEIADAVTVLRLGQTVAEGPMKDTSPDRILAQMAGAVAATEAAVEDERRHDRRERRSARPVLRTVDLRLTAGAAPTSIEICEGEIFGLAGLEGQGQVGFASCLSGLRKPASGRVEVETGGGWKALRSYRQATRDGVVFVPRERKQEGLFFSLSIAENYALPLLPSATRAGIVRRRALRNRFKRSAEQLRLVYGSPSDLIGTLSGGNQQKVLLGRSLATEPRVIVLNDPLRGVDANTKRELYEVFRSLAAEGLAIVLLSTEVRELLTLCDRIGVFHESALEAVLDGESASDTAVVTAMFGHRAGSDAA